MRLHVHEWGDRGAPPLVCLHGVTSHGGRFRRLGAHLASRFHVLAPDLRGHGLSDWEPPWSIESQLAAVLETVEVDRAVWIGHSFGGRLVAELAAVEPNRVERAILLDPALQVLPHVAFDMAELERRDVSFGSVEEAVQLRYDSGRVLLAPRELVLEDETPHLEPDRDGRFRYRYCKSAVVASWSEMATDPPRAAQVPTLLVLGEQSWLVLDEHVARYRDDLGAMFRVVYVPGGHTVMWDALEETTRAIDEFLEASSLQNPGT